MIRFLKVLGTFHLVALTWIFFRAGSWDGAMLYLTRLLTFQGEATVEGTPIVVEASAVSLAVLGALVLFLLIDLPQFLSREHTVLLRWPLLLRVLVLGLLVACLLMTRRNANAAFIYFQF
jgi:alginate O-acetyltransferase complex protein AlgI